MSKLFQHTPRGPFIPIETGKKKPRILPTTLEYVDPTPEMEHLAGNCRLHVLSANVFYKHPKLLYPYLRELGDDQKIEIRLFERKRFSPNLPQSKGKNSVLLVIFIGKRKNPKDITSIYLRQDGSLEVETWPQTGGYLMDIVRLLCSVNSEQKGPARTNGPPSPNGHRAGIQTANLE